MTKIGKGVKVGNFVEIKNSQIGDGSKIAHHAYVGDTIMGERVNIGAGVIVCNYDGKKKHQTKIGNDVFVGSNVNLLAPVTLHDNSFVAAGSTINKDVPSNHLGIARPRQENKPWSH